jgi:hypothetical protein
MKQGKTKAQMEILGLAVVVVIIIVAAAFFIRFSALKKQADYRTPFLSSELASNMLSTYLSTTSGECSKLTMTELLQDCAQSTGVLCDNGRNSCDYAEDAAKNIFGKTFDKWNMKYEFTACTNFDFKTAGCSPGSLLMNPLGERCTGQKEFKLFPIPYSAGTMYTKLDLCI